MVVSDDFFQSPIQTGYWDFVKSDFLINHPFIFVIKCLDHIDDLFDLMDKLNDCILVDSHLDGDPVDASFMTAGSRKPREYEHLVSLGSIRNAPDVDPLRVVAHDIRRFARTLLGQGVHAQQLTALISHLNDVLAARLVDIMAARHGIDQQDFCWIALGSEGRHEQTIATDQDNALILAPHLPAAAALAMALDINQALDACGYPLCKGQIMASNPACCLTLAQWQERFAGWIEQGAPQDLLNASIYFDFRPLAGNDALARTLREGVQRLARINPRFLRQMAVNSLQRAAPLNWLGSIDSTEIGGKETIDLKLQGTALFVDVARLYALAHGVAATGTRDRLQAVGPMLGVPEGESEAWIGGFEFLQLLRLHAQLDGTTVGDNPNCIDVGSLNDIDRRILKETLRVLRTLQQRVRLDYER